MTDEKLREKTEKEVKEFLENNWKEGFGMWLSYIVDMQMAFEDVVPYDVRYNLPYVFIYETGVRSGKRVCNWLFKNFNLEGKSVKERTYYTDAFFTSSGAGEIEFIKEEKKLRFKGGTFFTKMYGVIDKKVCSYIAGFIAGLTSCCMGREFVVEEVRCASAGDPHCEFVVREKE
ncbi:MAG: V4R domain-containing protein [Candidatus Syntropharchaeia archaeon]